MITDVQAVQAMVNLMVGTAEFSYPANKNTPRPPKAEFATVKFLEEYPESIPAQSVFSTFNHPTDPLQNTITYRTRSLARIRMRINVVETAGIASIKIAHGWTSEAMKTMMMDLGYGYIGCSAISIEDALLEKAWEPRQGFSVEFYVTRIFEEVVSTINSVTVTGGFVLPDAAGTLQSVNLSFTAKAKA